MNQKILLFVGRVTGGKNILSDSQVPFLAMGY